MPQENHQIVIGQLATRCSLLADATGADRLRVALDAALGERLTSALAGAAEPVLSGIDGVVRIRRMDVHLELGGEVEARDIAARLAARIAALLRTAFVDASGDVMVWADHDDYLADYLGSRLGLRALPEWPFDELATLDHLPTERAAAELIRARPALLPPLARMAAARGSGDAVVAGWPQSALAALTTALLAADPSAEDRSALAVAVTRVGPRVVPDELMASAEEVRAEALRLALRVLAQPDDDTPPRAAVIAAAALLTRLHLAPPSSSSRGRHHHLVDTGLSRALSLVAADPVAAAVLEALVRDARVMDGDHGDPKDRGIDAIDGLAMATPFAGLALLMPSVLALGAVDALGTTGLAQAVWQTLAEEDHDAAAQDAALAMVYPAVPQEVDLGAEQPVPPGHLVQLLDPAARSTYEAADPTRRWSALLLGDFASRLRGLHASSHSYLRAQFLRHPGTIVGDAEAVTVRLEPIPLGVVIRMAGHGTPPARIPQLGMRLLVLDLGDRG